jgi:hypothetical protein
MEHNQLIEQQNEVLESVLETIICEVQPSESQPSESQPSESQPSESQPSESQPSESQPSESQSLVPTSKPDHILPFKAIHTFVMSLNEEFGSRNKALRLYARLIEQTTFSHELPIRKHVQAFTQFCVNNRDAILTKNINQMNQPKIAYSDRVFINLKELFKMADADQQSVMWQHILTISALVDSSGRAKQILKKTAKKGSAKEVNFLTDMIEKVEKNINLDQASNPFEAITQIMSSGVLTDLIGSMNQNINSGQLDMSKMFGAIQGMIGTLSKEQPEMGQMINGLMQSLGNINEPPSDKKE